MPSAFANGLIPHRALYDITLHRLDKGHTMVNIAGEASLSVKATCNGWISDHLFTLIYDYRDTPPIKMTSAISSHESYDAKRFSFTTDRQRNGVTYEKIRGNLTKDTEKTVFTHPQARTVKTSKDTFLPMQHTQTLVSAAKNGRRHITLPLFDGSSDKGPMEVSAFITEATTPPHTLKNINSNTLLYKIDLAFFEQNSKNELAEYEITLFMYENGVIPYMLIDYGDLTIAQKITSIEQYKKAPCK